MLTDAAGSGPCLASKSSFQRQLGGGKPRPPPTLLGAELSLRAHLSSRRAMPVTGHLSLSLPGPGVGLSGSVYGGRAGGKVTGPPCLHISEMMPHWPSRGASLPGTAQNQSGAEGTGVQQGTQRADRQQPTSHWGSFPPLVGGCGSGMLMPLAALVQPLQQSVPTGPGPRTGGRSASCPRREGNRVREGWSHVHEVPKAACGGAGLQPRPRLSSVER